MDHLNLNGSMARQAVLTGDPGRVPSIAKQLGNPRYLSKQRGLLCWEASNDDSSTLVVATGIGAPATAIVVEELAEAGVHTLVRLGTCGAIQAHLTPGHLVLATGAVRDEGTSSQYVDISFPAVPHMRLTAALADQLSVGNWPYDLGIIHCKDAYYLERAERQILPDNTAQLWRVLRRTGVLATEMESSVLFVLGSLRRLRTATLLVVVGRAMEPGPMAKALEAGVNAIAGALDLIGPPRRNPHKLHERYSYLESESQTP